MNRGRPGAASYAQFVSVRFVSLSFLSLSILLAVELTVQPCFGQSFIGGAVQPGALIHPEVRRIAGETAKKVAGTGLRSILAAPLSGCFAAPELCAEFETNLRAELAHSIPGAQFVPRDDAVKHLAAHGFLAVDAYMGALDLVASYAGADVVVGEELEWEHHKCRLHTRIVDARRLYVLAEFSDGIPCSAMPGNTKLSAFRDGGAEVSMIAVVPQSERAGADAAAIRYPSCVSCPNPHYSGLAKEKNIQGSVQLLLTVGVDGAAHNARVMSGIDKGLEQVSLETVRGWQFTPAIGMDGKPFAARVPVEVKFRLVP